MSNVINDYDLFIFDLDDTLIKTEEYHYNAWVITLKKFINDDFSISKNEFFSIFHCITQNKIPNYLQSVLNLDNYNDIIEYKNKIYFENINNEKHNIKFIDGCEEFITQIIKNNKQFVIVSNCLKEHIIFFSELFTILKYSSKNYYREIIKHKKPHPECYQTVVSDFPNKKMVGFEDSITGIHAITQVPNIKTYFINTSDYYHYNYIIQTYPVINIVDYNQLRIIM
jgi:beta-phosphoglucomutase-like phosphatase (HAD superfamily)